MATRSREQQDQREDRVFESLIRRYLKNRDLEMVKNLSIVFGRLIQDREQEQGNGEESG